MCEMITVLGFIPSYAIIEVIIMLIIDHPPILPK